MENIGWVITILSIWSLAGLIIMGIANSIASDEYTNGALANAKGFEFFNPKHLYKHNRLNWFGVAMLTLFYNLISPISSICYWFYKLCTVGRK